MSPKEATRRTEGEEVEEEVEESKERRRSIDDEYLDASTAPSLALFALSRAAESIILVNWCLKLDEKYYRFILK